MEEVDKPNKRSKMGPPTSVHAGRRKATTKNTSGDQEDISKTAKSFFRENQDNSAVPPRGGLKIRLSSKLLDFDTEVERRHKEIEAEGQLASRALTEVLAIWKMQLPPLIKNMPLQQLNREFKGDISAALKKSAADKVTPLMTPLARRSVRKPVAARGAFHGPLTTPKTAIKIAPVPESFTTGTSSSSMDLDVESSSIDTSKLDIFSSSILTQFMSGAEMSDADKLATLAKLKKDIALLEKTLPSASKN